MVEISRNIELITYYQGYSFELVPKGYMLSFQVDCQYFIHQAVYVMKFIHINDVVLYFLRGKQFKKNIYVIVLEFNPLPGMILDCFYHCFEVLYPIDTPYHYLVHSVKNSNLDSFS